MELLESKTARLPAVEIVRPKEILGRSMVESIQSGLYYGTLATIKGLTTALAKEYFSAARPFVLATGGFGRLFEGESLFDAFLPELALIGLRRSAELSDRQRINH